MPKTIIANWKMSLSLKESVDLAKKLSRDLRSITGHAVVLCPSFPALLPVGQVLAGSKIALGAQDMFWETHGAYTGEVAAGMLQEVGCTHVIIGHSERRNIAGETDAMVRKKVAAAIAAGLTPILCVGEKFQERQEGLKDHVIAKQVRSALEGIAISSAAKLYIAYEPVWVIGSGQAVEPEEAQYTAEVIRQVAVDLFTEYNSASAIRVLYGGSVDAANITSFLRQPDVHGVLVGGASLKAETFSSMIQALV